MNRFDSCRGFRSGKLQRECFRPHRKTSRVEYVGEDKVCRIKWNGAKLSL